MQQRSKEWHEFRRNHIGSSDASVIMGLSPWKTTLQLYHEKTNDSEIPNSSNETFAMRRGVELEPLALAKFEAETGYLMTPRVLTSPFTPWRSASLDGYEIEGRCAVEIKASGKEDHSLALKGIVPEKYVPQLQHQMLVTELNEIYYMSYVSDSDFIIFKVKRDNDYIERLIAAESEFWQRVQDRNPPEPTDRDCPEITSESWANLSDQYAIANEIAKGYKDKLEQAEQVKDNIKNALIALADNRSVHGAGIKLSKCTRRGHIDYAKVPALIGLDLEPYRKESTQYWKVSFTGDNEEK